MKKFLLFASIVVLSISSLHAQSTKRLVGDTSVNTAGTILTFTNVPSKLFSIQASVAKIAGTAAGKVYLEATIDGNWIKQDSMTLSDQAINTKIFTVARTSFLSYRLNYVPTGSQNSKLTATYLRRSDE